MGMDINIGIDSDSTQDEPLFANPFQLEDLLIFDDATLERMLSQESFGLRLRDLAWSLHDAPRTLLRRVRQNVPKQYRSSFLRELHGALTREEIETARQKVLDSLFWELTYWKTPDLYEELTEGE